MKFREKWNAYSTIIDGIYSAFILKCDEENNEYLHEIVDDVEARLNELFAKIDKLEEQVSDLEREHSFMRQTMFDVQPEIRDVEVDIKPYYPDVEDLEEASGLLGGDE